MLGLSHECLQRASETSRRGRHHLDSGGHTICSRCWAEPIPSLAVHRGSPLARTDDRECEARSLGECNVITSAASTRKRSSTRLFRGERVSSSVRHTWAAATGRRRGLAGWLRPAWPGPARLGRCSLDGCCSRQRRQSRPLRAWMQALARGATDARPPPAARECTGVRQWWCVVRGRIGKHGAAGLAALLA